VRIVLGLDGGGSTTRLVLADEAGRVLSYGRSGSSNYHHAGEIAASKAIQDCFEQACRDAGLGIQVVAAGFLGLAGITSEADRSTIQQILIELGIVDPGFTEVDHDIRISLAGGLAGADGIALVSGTGSSCYGRSNGVSAQVGGLGPLADDVGSSYWVAAEACKLAVRQADGRVPGNEFRELVFSFLEIGGSEDFMHRVHTVGVSREQLARLCPGVIELANEGSDLAKGLLNVAVSELSQLVATAARRLALPHPKVILTGGLATSGPPFQPALIEAIQVEVPGAIFPEPALSPLGGAALEALSLLSINPTPTIIENLRNGLRAVEL